MELLWIKKIDSANIWEPELYGLFYSQNCKNMSFYYRNGHRIVEIDCINPDINTVTLCANMETLPLPHEWVCAEIDGDHYLLCGINVAVNLSKDALVCNYSKEMLQIYTKYHVPAEHFVYDSFCFGEYVIEHYGEWGYSCKKNGALLWRFSGRGYLYTEIYKHKNFIFFGTSGQGGYFYLLDIDTGKAILNLNTGGTTDIVCDNNKCYILLRKQNSRILCIDLNNGLILDSLLLPGKVTNYSKLFLYQKTIYTTTFAYRNGILSSANLCCISKFAHNDS